MISALTMLDCNLIVGRWHEFHVTILACTSTLLILQLPLHHQVKKTVVAAQVKLHDH